MGNYPEQYKKVFITGGTSGIGLGVARYYLQQGAQVGVCGRDIRKVPAEVLHPGLKLYQLDVYDKVALEKAVDDFAGGELDLMVIAAGNYSSSAVRRLTYEESMEMLKVNLIGAINAFEVARESMGKRRKGHIAAIASVAGLLHYPTATIYSKSKRTLIQVCDTYRRTLQDFGVSVTTIVPGYVDTQKLREINQNDLSRKSFVVTEERAVQTIVKAIAEKKKYIVFPLRMKLLIKLTSLLPYSWISSVMLKRAQWMEGRK
ncbi:MAG: SDR family NAD(P)-dependent oxidoreductase [Tannerellaceae bacterium]|nr:SDR family NAD(P)-dependent oxidoreductase [Tannerellaceae bacterium]